jgi:hypothetical protein
MKFFSSLAASCSSFFLLSSAVSSFFSSLGGAFCYSLGLTSFLSPPFLSIKIKCLNLEIKHLEHFLG